MGASYYYAEPDGETLGTMRKVEARGRKGVRTDLFRQ